MSGIYDAHRRAGNACNVEVGLFEVKRFLCSDRKWECGSNSLASENGKCNVKTVVNLHIHKIDCSYDSLVTVRFSRRYLIYGII
jgi:hypothetical protein